MRGGGGGGGGSNKGSLLRLDWPGDTSRGLLLLGLESHLLLVLLHQPELMLQLLQDLLLLGQQVWLVLQILEGLELLLGQIERRPLLLLSGLTSHGLLFLHPGLSCLARLSGSTSRLG